MKKNTAIDKWNRLRQKNLDSLFLNEIINGLNCSPFEATAVLETVHDVFGQYFETSGALKPGQMLFQAVAISNGPQRQLKDCELVTVTLTYDAGQEDLSIKEQFGVVALRRHRLLRMAHEAFDLGATLTVEDFAHKIFNCGERTICRDLAHFRKENIFIPLRSTVKDMGRTISHRIQIVKAWLSGREYTDIARSHCHSVVSVRNYIEKFKRVITLYENGFKINNISFLAKVSPNIISEYLKCYQDSDIIEHRLKEIKSPLKKTSLQMEQGGELDNAS